MCRYDLCFPGQIPLAVGTLRSFELNVVLFGPDPNATEGSAEAEAQLSERVVDAGRNDGMDGAGDEAVGLHLPKRFCQHLLTHGAEKVCDLGEAKGAVLGENFEDEHRPLVGDATDDLLNEGIDLGASASAV